MIGEPGQGKTATIENSTEGWGRHVERVIGSNREATDFLSVMIEDEGAIRYSSFQRVQNLNTSTPPRRACSCSTSSTPRPRQR
ncbi:hypothetical protein [Sinomonas atrocyanea]|uniref:hypothetical protein n=1 Tax=Sinomonas atrocyanea TaxID=37927 RepID=UPI0027871B40|nr:hypothetical protein [Sinomonas atrocyanea]MDQ0261371.1 hypothetical protein [Sinomonas atrocyanea]MDR6622930.1 hypothetical protein [Sinomonas atrocyanea]